MIEEPGAFLRHQIGDFQFGISFGERKLNGLVLSDGATKDDALDKIAFLPFGLLVDQYRWNVFAGGFPPTDYNRLWWKLRLNLQGIQPPVTRTEEDFDPGAKYHVPANVPYTRYFLAHILQFQFHRSLCEVAGFEGPLHRCSIYGNQEAGERLIRMLEMGGSQPWPDALEAITGLPDVEAGFGPLRSSERRDRRHRHV